MPLCSAMSVLLFGLLVSKFIFISMLFYVTMCGTRMSHVFDLNDSEFQPEVKM